MKRLVTVFGVHVGVNLDAPPESAGTYQPSLGAVRGLDPRRTGREAAALVQCPAWRSILPPAIAMEMAPSPRASTAAHRRIDRHVGVHRRAAFVLYAQAPATVIVSLTCPTNIPPLEAMAVGSALIVSDIYAMPEQVGDAALLVDPNSTVDIADKMERLWVDADLRRQLVEKGLARSATWTEEHFGARLRETVRCVAGRQR